MTITQQRRSQATPGTPHARIALAWTQPRPIMRIVSLADRTTCSTLGSLQDTMLPRFSMLVDKNHSRAVPTRMRKRKRSSTNLGISTLISITQVHGIARLLASDSDNRRPGRFALLSLALRFTPSTKLPADTAVNKGWPEVGHRCRKRARPSGTRYRSRFRSRVATRRAQRHVQVRKAITQERATARHVESMEPWRDWSLWHQVVYKKVLGFLCLWNMHHVGKSVFSFCWLITEAFFFRIAIALAITIPRVPGLSFYGSSPLIAATGSFNASIPILFSRSPANFTFPAFAQIQVDTTSNIIPLTFDSISAQIWYPSSNMQIGTGYFGKKTLPAKSFPVIQIPLNFTYIATNQTDPTWVAWYDACKNSALYPGGTRPGM